MTIIKEKPKEDDQNLWNGIFSAVFLVIAVVLTVIVFLVNNTMANDVSALDFIVLSLATLRVVQLFVYDPITDFFRELFYDKEERLGDTGEKVIVHSLAPRGPRRTVAELLSCPWCVGIWAALFVAFFYLLTPLSHFLILVCAIAGVAPLLKIAGNLLRWEALEAKERVQKE
jgi:hypothetical protein